jgi:hypothetical protein
MIIPLIGGHQVLINIQLIKRVHQFKVTNICSFEKNILFKYTKSIFVTGF